MTEIFCSLPQGMLLGKLGTTLTTEKVVLTVVSVALAGAGVGAWAIVNSGPTITVVQRNAIAEVDATSEQTAIAEVDATSEQTAIADCLEHETAINGGYSLGGKAFATRGHFYGDNSWLVSAYNPGDDAVPMTVYVVCVNAKVEFVDAIFIKGPHAYRDRLDKKTLAGDGPDMSNSGPYATLPRHSKQFAHSCGTTAPIGVEFRADRSISGRPVAPAPLEKSRMIDGTGWEVRLNPGSTLNNETVAELAGGHWWQYTRILEKDQFPQVNYAVLIRPICPKLSAVGAGGRLELAVPVGDRASTSLGCPKGKHVVGGGFGFAEPLADEAERFLADGFLYASRSAPADGEASGSRIRAWHFTGVNLENPGYMFDNTTWRLTEEEGGYKGFMGNNPRPEGAAPLSSFPIPDHEAMKAEVMCATIDLEPTEPPPGPKPPIVGRPDLGPVIELPSPAASPSLSPSASPSASPSPSATHSTQPPTPQAPTVTINQPQPNDQLCYGINADRFSATAKTKPGNVSITSSQYTKWEIVPAVGERFTLGTGVSGGFTIDPNKVPYVNQPHRLIFAATDPNNGKKTSKEIQVWIGPQSCS